MIIQQLVQNYFERIGSFEGIRNTSVSNYLNTIAENNSVSVEEICYRFLGYGDRNAKKNAEIRIKLFNEDESALKGSNCASLDALRKQKKMRKIVQPKKINKPVYKGFPGLEDLIAYYYKNDPFNTIEDESGYLPFGVWLQKHRKSSVNSIWKLPCVQECLIKVAVQEGCEPWLEAGILYLPLQLDKKQFEHLNKAALTLAMGKCDCLSYWSDLSFTDLAMLSVRKPKRYLEMLDYCAATGITYASLVENFGYRVPNLFVVFDNTGFVFMCCDDNILCMSDELKRNWECYPKSGFAFKLASGEEVLAPSVDYHWTEKSHQSGGIVNEIHSF